MQAPAETEPAYVGAVDRLIDGVLSGWAVTLAGDPCEVTVRLGGETVCSARSDGPRPDLHAKQQSRGAGGWAVALGERAVPGAAIEVLLPDGTHLAGSPLTVQTSASPAPPDGGALTYVGAIDASEGDFVAGWALSSRFEPAPVRIRVNNHPEMVVESANDRADLIAQQLTQSGGGWQLRIAELLADGPNQISVTFPDGGHLPGSPIQRWVGEARPVPVERASEPAAPVIPSLAELDELNLDDLSLAVAAGLITVAPPVVEAIEVRKVEPVAPPLAPPHGFLARLLGR